MASSPLAVPTQPTVGGWTWLTTPAAASATYNNNIAYVYQKDALQAVQISTRNNENGILSVVGSIAVASPVLNVATSYDGRLVAVATADGNLTCYNAAVQPATTTIRHLEPAVVAVSN